MKNIFKKFTRELFLFSNKITYCIYIEAVSIVYALMMIFIATAYYLIFILRYTISNGYMSFKFKYKTL